MKRFALGIGIVLIVAVALFAAEGDKITSITDGVEVFRVTEDGGVVSLENVQLPGTATGPKIDINHDATANTIGTVISTVDIVTQVGDGAGLATGGAITGLHITVGGTNTASQVDAITVGGTQGVIRQNIWDNVSGETIYRWTSRSGVTDISESAAATHMDTNFLVKKNECLYFIVGTEFDGINVQMSTVASQNLLCTFAYSDTTMGDTISSWKEFNPTDFTDGFTRNGAIVWGASMLTNWQPGQDTVIFGNVSDTGHVIRITRTLPLRDDVTGPVEDKITAITYDKTYQWDDGGNVSINTLSLAAEFELAQIDTPTVVNDADTGTIFLSEDALYSDTYRLRIWINNKWRYIPTLETNNYNWGNP